MINFSAMNNPLSVCDDSTVSSVGKLVCSGLTSLFKSIDPRYIPEHLQNQGEKVAIPSFSLSTGKVENQYSEKSVFFHPVAELAFKFIAAYGSLPTEVLSLISNLHSSASLVNFFCQHPKFIAKATGVKDATNKQRMNNEEEKNRKKPQVRTSSHRGKLSKAAMVVGAVAVLPGIGSAAEARRTAGNYIEVKDVETLKKIGHDPSYPMDGSYVQTADIDAKDLHQSIGDQDHPFNGTYDGQFHKINQLSHCLFKKVENGIINNLHIINAKINSDESAAVIAGSLSGESLVSNNLIENTDVVTSGKYADAAIVAATISGTSQVHNNTAINCNVLTSGFSAHGGIGAGFIIGSAQIKKIMAVNDTVYTSGDIHQPVSGGGIIIGSAQIKKIMAVGSTVSTSGHHSPAGIGVGHILGSAQVQEITAVSCTVNGELRNFDNKTETVISQKKAPLWEIAATSSPGEIAATSSPAITISVLVVAGVAFLCIVYLTYQWFAGYSEGLRGKKLACVL